MSLPQPCKGPAAGKGTWYRLSQTSLLGCGQEKSSPMGASLTMPCRPLLGGEGKYQARAGSVSFHCPQPSSSERLAAGEGAELGHSQSSSLDCKWGKSPLCELPLLPPPPTMCRPLLGGDWCQAGATFPDPFLPPSLRQAVKLVRAWGWGYQPGSLCCRKQKSLPCRGSSWCHEDPCYGDQCCGGAFLPPPPVREAGG